MICRFIMPNEEYSEAFAIEHHGGEESDDNYKELWEDEIELKGAFDEIQIEDSGVYTLNGQRGEEPFAIEIADMKIWRFKGETENQIAVSNSIIEEAVLERDLGILEVLFKEKSVVSNVIPGVYIDVDAFPKELKS